MANGIRFFSAGPVTLVVLALLIICAVVLLPLLFIGLVGAAFTRLGFTWMTALAVIVLMLVFSLVNIPLYTYKRSMIRAPFNTPLAADPFSGMDPAAWETKITLNIGGAVIPAILSAYLFWKGCLVEGPSLYSPVCAAIVSVTIVTYFLTRSHPALGVRVPTVVPSLTALALGVLLCGGLGLASAVTAFVGGVLGTLIGGGILQCVRVGDLDVRGISIGGAGSFGAVFLCCLLPALIAYA
jgi:uncharacterized membrane protein